LRRTFSHHGIRPNDLCQTSKAMTLDGLLIAA
jgi:hypothetical protein